VAACQLQNVISDIVDPIRSRFVVLFPFIAAERLVLFDLLGQLGIGIRAILVDQSLVHLVLLGRGQQIETSLLVEHFLL
jgi:hypothetical protein